MRMKNVNVEKQEKLVRKVLVSVEDVVVKVVPLAAGLVYASHVGNLGE